MLTVGRFSAGVGPLILRELSNSFQFVAYSGLSDSSSTAPAVGSQRNQCLLASCGSGYSSRPCVQLTIRLLPSSSVARCESRAVWSIPAGHGEVRCEASLRFVPSSSTISGQCHCTPSIGVRRYPFCHNEGIVRCH